MSFSTYVNAQTVAAKYDQRLGVHPDFLAFVGDSRVFDESFYNLRFHVVWGNYGQSSYGPGDLILFRFTPGKLECVSIHKSMSTFLLGELQKQQNMVFPGDITWTFSPSLFKKDGEVVHWITGKRGDQVLYNYSVVPIRF